MSPPPCRVCGGPLELLYPGIPDSPRPAEMAPTNHTPGGYGDLYRCASCGSVAQPSLPEGEELRALYRRMRDDAYLEEEAGRRRTARRLLGMVEKQVRPGRLLEAGCGHGLLLDEARARGWQTLGLDLSPAAAAHARDVLELDVREVALQEFSGDAGFDAVLLVDVIEHFDDPGDALARCTDLLAPGGVLLIATPDPASRVARLAGPRWWGYLRAHALLLPRERMRRMLEERGLRLVASRPLVRTFSARYWFSGASERGGPLGKAARVVGRVAPDRLPLSLTLLDEYVMVARRAR